MPPFDIRVPPLRIVLDVLPMLLSCLVRVLAAPSIGVVCMVVSLRCASVAPVRTAPLLVVPGVAAMVLSGVPLLGEFMVPVVARLAGIEGSIGVVGVTVEPVRPELPELPEPDWA